MINILMYLEDEGHLSFFKEVFEEYSADVKLSVCHDPDEAMMLAAMERVDLLVADLKMVKGGRTCFKGFLFLDRFRSRPEFRFTYMLVISDLEDERFHGYNRLHCYGYFTRPLNERLFRSEVIPLCGYLEMLRALLEKAEDPIHCFRRRSDILVFRESELVRFEIHKKHGHIVTVDGEYDVAVEPIREDDGLVCSERFIRYARYDYVNTGFIRGMRGDRILLYGDLGEIYYTPLGRRNLEQYFSKIEGRLQSR